MTATTTATTINDNVRRRRGRRVMTLVFLVCAAPIVLGTLAYYLFPPTGRTNYGELLPLTPFQVGDVTASLQGRWILVTAGDAGCDESCAKRLHLTRQVRTIQGRNQDRVGRVWLVADQGTPRGELATLLEGVTIIRMSGIQEIERVLGAGGATRIHLIDPLGHRMMRFPEDPDPKRVTEDLQRLLRVNNQVR